MIEVLFIWLNYRASQCWYYINVFEIDFDEIALNKQLFADMPPRPLRDYNAVLTALLIFSPISPYIARLTYM